MTFSGKTLHLTPVTEHSFHARVELCIQHFATGIAGRLHHKSLFAVARCGASCNSVITLAALYRFKRISGYNYLLRSLSKSAMGAVDSTLAGH